MHQNVLQNAICVYDTIEKRKNLEMDIARIIFLDIATLSYYPLL